MSGPLAQLLALVIEIESNQETEAQLLARLAMQSAADPIDDRDEYAAVETWRDAECDGEYKAKSTYYIE